MTSKREKSCCVERSYVRNVYDYFTLSEDISQNKAEAEKINASYITDWEKLHDSYVGTKKPEDLVVCYLSGPEPNNDFQELINLGILPHNIWAFESDNQAYRKAIAAYNQGEYPQPRILKQNIETFFQQTPKKFDIIYIDACGSIPSTQHILRSVFSVCQNHRLNSPGVIITNFAMPDIANETIGDYYELISQYLFFKKYSFAEFEISESRIKNKEYDNILNSVIENFEKLRELFNHSKKGIQYKTDQNFYFLWAILFKIPIEELQNRRQENFNRISKIFSSIQKVPVNYTTEMFLREIE